ncbi:multidrug effflux MFS transporter [Mucilaginibacter sp. HMF5004]|uniref:multidrug effflux MFS transporter n=1 Tax=Mucilaginibacter rivuli TaxID=2857527 RepID=UPI001C6026F2|nr:multidrug effflux MFS transporter [Mucilaginibacter rivuli]MBW4891364.1 multidrug effflux MFS transporter [Mucilaginibacter rivuli]
MGRKQYIIIILILGFIIALGALSIDMYLPAFKAIAADLHTDESGVQLSLSSYFLGISFGQLLYGPLLDRYGRKKPLYIGLLVYIIASVACALTRSISVLIALRLIQALGGCAGIVAARAFVRDLFPVKDIAKVFSLLLLVLVVSPMLAPTIGGYVSSAWGWHYIFIILAAVAVIVVVSCIIWLPDGRQPDTTLSLKPKHITNSFWSVFKHPQFFTYALTGCIGMGGQYAYLAGSSYVFISYYHVDQKHFGYIFAIIAAGLIGFSQVNSLVIRKISGEIVMKNALILQCIVGIVLFGLTYSGYINMYCMIGIIFLFLSVQGFITPNATALSLAPFASQAGIASALMGFLQMGLGALSAAIVSHFNEGRLSPIPMVAIMMISGVMALIFLFVTNNFVSKKEFTEPVLDDAETSMH